MTHTPGPWSAHGTYVYGDNNIVAECLYSVGQGEDTRANARLIAASPSLLEALTNLCAAIQAVHDDLGTHYPAIAEAWVLGLGAIAKAEGK